MRGEPLTLPDASHGPVLSVEELKEAADAIASTDTHQTIHLVHLIRIGQSHEALRLQLAAVTQEKEKMQVVLDEVLRRLEAMMPTSD